MPDGGLITVDANCSGEVRLGGIGEQVAQQLQRLTGKETRSTALDRILGMRFGVMAVKLAEEGRFGRMVSYQAYHVDSVLIEEAVNKLRLVDPEGEVVQAAKAVGICMGN